jgi:hypothetical protein
MLSSFADVDGSLTLKLSDFGLVCRRALRSIAFNTAVTMFCHGMPVAGGDCGSGRASHGALWVWCEATHGAVCRLHDLLNCIVHRSTPQYVAPEVWAQQPYGKKVRVPKTTRDYQWRWKAQPQPLLVRPG